MALLSCSLYPGSWGEVGQAETNHRDEEAPGPTGEWSGRTECGESWGCAQTPGTGRKTDGEKEKPAAERVLTRPEPTHQGQGYR